MVTMATIEKVLNRRLRGRRFRQMSLEITAAQQRLRDSVSPRAWRVYLDLEQLAGARTDAIMASALRIAFRHGQRALLLAVVCQLEIG
jgi:hypothetical protein